MQLPSPTAREGKGLGILGASLAVPVGCGCTLGCGILGGNGAGDPGAAPQLLAIPKGSPGRLSLCFPILLDPGTPLGTVWDSLLGAAPGLGHSLRWEFPTPIKDPRKPHPWEIPSREGGIHNNVNGESEMRN